MGKMVTLDAEDGHSLSAYVANADNSSKGNIVVIQEIFGVNNHIRDVCDRYAKVGYNAIAPALFDRIEKDLELDYSTESVQRGIGLKNESPDDLALQDIRAARDYFGPSTNTAVVGYCWGGTLSYLTACKLDGFSKAIGYYGGGIAAAIAEQPQIPLLLHFGDQDASIPLTDVDAIMTAHPEAAIYVYQAGHGFNCDRRAGYDAEATKTALKRSLDFLEGK